jgi:hypothetical protein
MEFVFNIKFVLCLFFFIKWLRYFNNKKEEQQKTIEDVKEEKKEKPVIKYQDKYLEELREMPNDIIFTDDEKTISENLYPEFYQNALNDLTNLKKNLKVKIKDKQNELNDLHDMINNTSEEEEDATDEENIKKELSELENEFNALNEKKIDEEKIRLDVKNHIIQIRLDNLKNCFIIEKTPLGNVIMIYNNKKTSFEYYSDSTIPYRYLEPIARKYVITYKCRSIYVDMEEELKESEKKLKELENEKKERELMEKAELENGDKLKNNKLPIKKNVFAKFKNYNKEAGSGRVNKAPPPKNSIPLNVKIDKGSNEKVVLKDNANRYTCEGRFSNFNILQKVDRKKIDKKYAMTFADFKKMNKK